MKTKNKYAALLIIVVLLASAVITGIWIRNKGSDNSVNHNLYTDTMPVTTPARDTLPYLVRPLDRLTLADSTHIIMLKGTKVTTAEKFPALRQVTVDGDLFFDIPAGKRPFIIRTNLLVLTATGHCSFRVIAYAKDGAEEIQVLNGKLRAQKSYVSDFPEPDTLVDNQLLMINRSIDLMEKENDALKELRAWWEQSPPQPKKDL